MCIAPRKILNRKANYKEGIDKVYITIPCGKCYECVKQKADGWFVRSCYEFSRSKRLGGTSYFPTLTYNDDMLPSINLDDSKFDGLRKELKNVYNVDMPPLADICFSKKDIQKFFRRFRQLINGVNTKIYLKGLDGQKVNDFEFKYFVTSEFGKNTKRPHYHVKLDTEKKVDEQSLHDLLQIAWSVRVPISVCPLTLKNFLKKFKPSNFFVDSRPYIFTKDIRYFPSEIWKYEYVLLPSRGLVDRFEVHRLRGFVSWSNKGKEIISPAGCRYISKYIQKQSIFEEEQYSPKVLRDFLSQIPRPYDGIYHDDLKEIKNCLPFTLSSQFYGEDLEHELLQSYSDGKLKEFLDAPVKIEGDITTHKVPQYIINRVFYQNRHYVKLGNDAIFRTLSPIGYEALLNKFMTKVDTLDYQMQLFFNTNYLSHFPQDIFKCEGISNLQFCEVANMFKSQPLKFVSIYSILFQDVVSRHNQMYYPCNGSAFVDDAYCFYTDYLDHYNIMTDDMLSPYDKKKMFGKFDFEIDALLNNLEQFRGLDLIVDLYYKLRSICCKYITTLEMDDDKRNYLIKLQHNLSY